MWRPFNFTLHICWFFALIVLARDFHFVDPTLYDAVLRAQEREVLALAVQLGRLDFLNSILAILAIVIAGGAILGILEVRKGAQLRAEEAVQQYLNREAPRLFGEALKAQEQKPQEPDIGTASLNEQTIMDNATELKENDDGQVNKR